MDVERRSESWLVTIPQRERHDLIRDGEHPPDHAIAAVAHQNGLAADNLHSFSVRVRDGRVEVVVRRA